MLKQLTLNTAIIILLGLGYVLHVSSVKIDKDEVFGENYHGYFVYEAWRKGEKFAEPQINQIISKFESKVVQFIDGELMHNRECKNKILDRLEEYKRYYQLWSDGKNELRITFSHKQIFEFGDKTVKDEPWVFDGGESQFRIVYDYNYAKITYFGINGPICYYSVRPKT